MVSNKTSPGSSERALVFCFDGSGVRVNGAMRKPAGDRFRRPEPQVRVVQRLAEGRLIAFHATSIPGEMSQMVIVCPNAGARAMGYLRLVAVATRAPAAFSDHLAGEAQVGTGQSVDARL